MMSQFSRYHYHFTFLVILLITLESDQLPVHAAKNEQNFVKIPGTEFDELLERNSKGALLVFTVSEQCFNTSYERYKNCEEFSEDFKSTGEQVAKRNAINPDFLPLQVAVVYGHSRGAYFKKYGIYGPLDVHIYVEGVRHLISDEADSGAVELVDWVYQMISPKYIQVDSMEQFLYLKYSARRVILGYFQDINSEPAQKFRRQFAHFSPDIMVCMSSLEQLREVEGLEYDTVTIYKTGLGEPNVTKSLPSSDPALTPDDFMKWVVYYIQDYTVDLAGDELFNYEMLHQLRGLVIWKVSLLCPHERSGIKYNLMQTYKAVAKKFRGKAVFQYTQFYTFKYASQAELDTINKTTCLLIATDDDIVSTKYILHSKEPYTQEAIESFVQNTLDGKQKPTYKKQDLPEDWDKNSVITLVHDNYNEIVLDKEKDVLVKYHLTFCGVCKRIKDAYQQAADHFAETRKDVVLAEIDISQNEVELFNTNGVPTVILVTKGDNKLIRYKGGSYTTEDLISFVETQGRDFYGTGKPEKDEEVAKMLRDKFQNDSKSDQVVEATTKNLRDERSSDDDEL